MVEASGTDQSQKRQQPVEDEQVPRYRGAIIVCAVLLLIAAAGIALLICFSQKITPENAAAYSFVAQNLLSLLIFLAVVAQALIYVSQRNLMHRQWRSMQGQLDAIEQQGKTMRRQAIAAVSGARFARDSLTETKNLVTQNARSIKLAETGIEAAEKSAIYANRAYLVAKIRNDDAYHFKLAIENGGSTPANNVKVSYACRVMQDPPWQLDQETNQVVYDIGFDITVQLGVIAPNGSHGTVETVNFTPRTDPERQEWEHGVKLFCWGWIYYEDIFDEKRHTEFCFYKSLQQPQGHPCDYGNEAF